MSDLGQPPFALGVRQPSNPLRARLQLRDFVRAVPDHPIAVDDTDGVAYGLDGNDAYGVCVPTGKDNLHRTVSKLLTGEQVSMTQDEVFDDYRSQNPNFNPDTNGDADDNGMVIQDYLEYLARRGDILAFASVDLSNDDEVRAANYLFLGLLVGVNLAVAQQRQTDTGTWTYVPGSPAWGGHCVAQVGYGTYGEKVITWQRPVAMSPSFYAHQRFEAWVVLFPEHIAYPAFRAGFDLTKFKAAYEELTGRPFPVDVPPEPKPPVPPAPGGGWFQVDSTVAVALHHAAVARGLTDQAELNRILRGVLRVG